MKYTELLEKLAPQGICEIGRLQSGDGTIVFLGRKITFPFAGELVHTMYLEEGDNPEIHTEEVKAVLRKFPPGQFI